MHTTIYDGCTAYKYVSHPWGGVPISTARQPKRVPIVPIPNATYVFGKLSLYLSRRDVPNDDLIVTGPYSNCGEIDHGKIGPGGGGGRYTPSYTGSRCFITRRVGYRYRIESFDISYIYIERVLPSLLSPGHLRTIYADILYDYRTKSQCRGSHRSRFFRLRSGGIYNPSNL